MAAEQLEALAVTSTASMRYLTGFSGSSGLVLVTPAWVSLLTDFRYRDQAANEVGDLARLSIDNSGLWERARKQLEPAVGEAGFEADVVTARDAARLQAQANGVRFRPAPPLVEALRSVKAPEEVEAIRAAGALATRALAETLPGVRAGQTEFEVAAALEGALRRLGSEWFPFPTIVASGPRAALPHARTSGRVLSPGDLLLLDYGAIVDGYCSDITRTVVVGAEPTQRQRDVYDVVQRAQHAALTGLRAGLTGRQADALARDPITAAGLGDAFGHSLGHGVGLEVHEAPRLARTVEEPLAAGAVVTVEPGVYLEGWGGVRIEDDVVITGTGAELLTEFTRELIRVG